MTRLVPDRKSLLYIGVLFVISLGVTVGLALYITLNTRDDALRRIEVSREDELAKRRAMVRERIDTLVELTRLAASRSAEWTHDSLKHEVDLLESLTRVAMSQPGTDLAKPDRGRRLAEKLRPFLFPQEETVYFLAERDATVNLLNHGLDPGNRIFDRLADSTGFRDALRRMDTEQTLFVDGQLPEVDGSGTETVHIGLRHLDGTGLLLGAATSAAKARRSIQKEVLDRYAGITFENHPDDYLWVIHVPDGLDGVGHLLLNTNPAFTTGQPLTRTFTDARGKPFYAQVLDGLKASGEAFSVYALTKPSSGEIAEKISFFKQFEPWSWIVGTGIYLDDLEAAHARRRADVMATKRFNMRVIVIGFVTLFAVFSHTVLVVAHSQRRATTERTALIESILDTQSSLIMVLDGDRLVNVNARLLAFLGYPDIEALARERRRVCDFFLPGEDMLPPSQARWVEGVLRNAAEGRVSKAMMRNRATGADHVFIIRAAHLEDARRELVVSFTDVTEQQAIEAQLKNSHRALEASNQELTQFAYAISHDLQEPLRMVTSYMELLKMRLANRLDDETREFLAFALDGADRMRRMINDLLDYSRLLRHRGDLVPVPLNDVADMAAANLKLTLDETKADLKIQPMPPVLGDFSQLVRLFQNLIGNALKYRHPDRPPMVHVNATRHAAMVTIEVADNGIGIPADGTERIFGIFQRLNQGHSGGSGIGLAQCRRIVELHGGQIWVESEPGKGSRFRFLLKAAPEPDD